MSRLEPGDEKGSTPKLTKDQIINLKLFAIYFFKYCIPHFVVTFYIYNIVDVISRAEVFSLILGVALLPVLAFHGRYAAYVFTLIYSSTPFLLFPVQPNLKLDLLLYATIKKTVVKKYLDVQQLNDSYVTFTIIIITFLVWIEKYTLNDTKKKTILEKMVDRHIAK